MSCEAGQFHQELVSRNGSTLSYWLPVLSPNVAQLAATSPRDISCSSNSRQASKVTLEHQWVIEQYCHQMEPSHGVAATGQASRVHLVMALLAIVLLLSTAAAVSTLECICPASYNPVCAENGVTYSNPCTARCAGV